MLDSRKLMRATNTKIARVDYRTLFDVLPGKNKYMLNISNIFPNDILKLLDSLKGVDFDTILLANVDTWFFHSFEPELFAHPALKNKNVIIQTIEYDSKYLGDNHWRISYPIWYTHRILKEDKKFIPKDKKLPYGFGCLNNRPALHRLLLGTELFNRGLLDKIVFVQNNTKAFHRDTTHTLYAPGEIAPHLLQDPDLLDNTPGYKEYKKLLPIRWNNEEIKNNHAVYHYAESQTYCNITTESVTEMIPYTQNVTLPEVSEKSHKTFISGQIPIFLAAPGHNQYFKNLGFEFVDQLTCDNFDNFRTYDRIRAIADVVEKGRDYIEDTYFNNLDLIKHNHELIYSNKTDQILLDRVKLYFE
jgi:hypothetical protein